MKHKIVARVGLEFCCASAAAMVVLCGTAADAMPSYDPEDGVLTLSVSGGQKPWVFRYMSDGTLVKCIQQGDAKVLDFRPAAFPEGAPQLRVLGANCLSGTGVEEVYLPSEGLVSIAHGVFSGCRKLRRIEPLIPDSVTHFGTAYTLDGCGALEGTLVIGGSGAKMNSLPRDNRFLFRGLGRIGAIVFGEGLDQSWFKWSYGGFVGAGSVTSIVCRVKETLDWSQGVSYPEACRTCLFQDMKNLRDVEVCGFISNASGLPDLKPGVCRIRVPGESVEWKGFISDGRNVIPWSRLNEKQKAVYQANFGGDATVPAGIVAKNNAISVPAGYWVVVKSPVKESPRWTYQPKVPELLVDPDAKPIRDTSESSAFPIMGFAGSMVAEWGEYTKWFFVDHREETARVFRQAGVRLVRQWTAVDQWQMGAGCGRSWRKQPGFNYEEYRTDMKNVFQFYKDYGIRAFLTLENYSVYTDAYNGKRSDNLETVKKVICDYVKWIVDNGFKECVAGFELGNEPYFNGTKDIHHAETYAARWTPIVLAIKKIWPEAPIGIALAEYMKGDPDVKAVRARMLAEKKIDPKGYWDESAVNQWSGRYVVAMKPVLDKIDHVIYHAYGGAVPESCSYCGICRFRGFTKAFPELAGKKFWITEWRERSDEDNRCHQRFHETLFKAGYMTMMLAQPDVDGLSLHQFNSISGALYLSGAAPASAPKWHSRTPAWSGSWDAANCNRSHPSSIGTPHLEVGISGPVFRLYNEALMQHPVVLDFGGTKSGFQSCGSTNAVWSASKNYSNRKDTDCQVLVTMNKEKTSLALLAVNTREVPAKLALKVPDKYRMFGPDYRVYSCPKEFLYRHELPGEGKFTKQYGYEEFPAPSNPYTVEIPALSVTTVTIPIRRK